MKITKRKRRKPGRPKMAPKERKSEKITVVLTIAERETYEKLAEAAGLSTSAWFARAAAKAARQESGRR